MDEHIDDAQLAEFLDEAGQNLQALEAGLQDAERDLDHAAVQVLFRAAHSIKGLAGMLGLEAICRLTHDLETVFDAIRSQRLAFDSEVRRVALEAVDLLALLLEELGDGTLDGSPITDCCQRLAAILTPQQVPDDGAPVATVTQPDPGSQEYPPFMPDGLLDFLEIDALIAENDGLEILAVGTSIDGPGLDEALAEIAAHGQVLREFDRDAWRGALIAVPDGHRYPPLAHWRFGVAAETCCRLPDHSPPAAEPSPTTPAGDRNEEATSSGGSGERHHLRTLRVETDRLDELFTSAGELVVTRAALADRTMRLERELLTLGERFADGDSPELQAVQDRMQDLLEQVVQVGRCAAQVQRQAMGLRMVPVGPVLKRFHRVVRDVCRHTGRQASLVLIGEGVELDKQLVDELVDPLTHLVRNAVDHGLEDPESRRAAGKEPVGRIEIRAERDGGQIAITVADDGGGIDAERIRAKAIDKGLLDATEAAQLTPERCLDLLFASGFSTAAAVTDISGRGVGLDIVRSRIESLKGSIAVHATPGAGTRFCIRLPLTLSICKVQLVEIGGAAYGLPMDGIREVLQFRPEDCRAIQGGNRSLRLRGQVVAVCDPDLARGTLDLPPLAAVQTAVVIRSGHDQLVLPVDRVIGEEEVVVKALPSDVAQARGLAGASVLGDGRVALIADVGSLIEQLTATSDPRKAA